MGPAFARNINRCQRLEVGHNLVFVGSPEGKDNTNHKNYNKSRT